MTRKAEPSPVLTVRQAARQLGRGKDYVYRLCKAGLLGYIDMPPASGERAVIGIEQDELDRFKARYRKPASAT